MQKDIRLHGLIAGQIEYYAIVAGIGAHQRYFFNQRHDDEELRFFSPGNEFIIGREGVSYRGNGGSFCEYMFGVDQPISDLAKGDVINRLVIYGARYDSGAGALEFSDVTAGSQSFEKIFFDGNAVYNYFFFVNSDKLAGAPREQQEEIVKLLGKAIKRSVAVGDGDDNGIIEEIFALLDDAKALLFLFKLINTRHQEYCNLFKSLYFRNKKISDDEFTLLSSLAGTYDIDRYQQERIRIDVMYKHPDNRRIVDEYKNILITCNRRGEINKLENARLTRLKTLSVRNKIPGALFYTLDEMLKKDKKMVDLEENDYISETREILEGIFLSERQIESTVDREDMLKLLFAKKKAAENRDHSFEEILLDASKACDEKIRDGADISLLEGFSYIITYFDRYDSTSSIINQLAFMENLRVTEEMLRSLLGNKSEFDLLKQGLFEELFISGILDNKYLGSYGRKKVTNLVRGLRLIEEKRLATSALQDKLIGINAEERLFQTLLEHVRERIRNFYSKYSTKADQELLKREVAEELRHKKLLDCELPDELFNEVILTIKKEAIYIHSLLPTIIASKDIALREDFLENSGLDRFYVEELEREYYELNDLDMDELYQIRKGLN
ncbi:MAG: TIGR04442 family protein [Geobacteraceae bacterium]|nr:TIGR04442 family protein [Geobacteraceae bacterium]